jgi:DNA adenine methylase
LSLRQALTLQPQRPKPFLKWAGGKGRLLNQLEPFFPSSPKVYFEPFIGGGAVFLYLASTGRVKKAFLNDINTDLAQLYKIIRDCPNDFINEAEKLSSDYLSVDGEARAAYYYGKRQEYNSGKKQTELERAAATVFLNKTCFNGLYRVNSKGKFNVPAGRYAEPTIFEPENIMTVSALLNKTEAEITSIDFEKSLSPADKGCFVYYDPPYRPLNRTSCFTTYCSGGFDDAEQKRLAKVYSKLSKFGALQMLSNSDPKNTDPEDTFFDDLYKGNRIVRVKAARMINSKAGGRSSISELLITNY